MLLVDGGFGFGMADVILDTVFRGSLKEMGDCVRGELAMVKKSFRKTSQGVLEQF